MTAEEIARDEAMSARVAATLEEAGVLRPAAAAVLAAHGLAMAPRRARLSDPHDPAFLHPGRVALILLLDTPFRDPIGLAAAVLVESERAELRVGEARVRAELGQETDDLLRAVPLDPEGLAEALVTAPYAVRMVALAERLDQCRHAKFWSDRTEQRRIHGQAVTIFAPVAERTDATLTRRFVHWSGAFERTLRRG